MHRWITLALLLSTAPGWAQPYDEQPLKGWYLGGGAVYANVYSWDDDDDDDDDGWNLGDADYGDGDLGYVLTGGYRFNDYFALELGYVDSGTLGWDEDGVFDDDELEVVNVDADIEISSVQVSALGVLPFFDVFDIFVRGGLAFWDADSRQKLVSLADGDVTRRKISDDGTDLLFGIGGSYTFREHWNLRLEYSQYETDDDLLALSGDEDAYTDMFALQLLYRFGQKDPGDIEIEKPD